MADFDGNANLRRYDPSVFVPSRCDFLAFDCNEAFTLSRMEYAGSDVYLLIMKKPLSVRLADNGVFADFIRCGHFLSVSAGAEVFVTNSKSVQLATSDARGFIGFTAAGIMRLEPGNVLSAIENGLVNAVHASPFLVVNGKRLLITDDVGRVRERLIFGQLKTGEKAFIYLKGADIQRAADCAFQFGFRMAAVVANDGQINVYARGFTIQRCDNGGAVFVG
jgi:hypothetical protein